MSQEKNNDPSKSQQQPILSSKPTLKKLQQTKIITDVGSKWFELGIELLDEDQSTQLDIIKTNNNEVTRRCGEMFLFWLNTHPNATWQNLVDALKAPGVELNDVAAKVETHFNVGLSASQSSVPVSYVPENQIIVPSFDISNFNSIAEAYIYLTSNVSKLLQKEDFYAIRRSCIEQISTPNGAQLSPDVVQKIKTANNLNALLDTLAESPYWSWIDLRLLEAMVTASGSSVAKDLLTKYRNTVFSKKLLEVLPSVPNIEIKDEYYSKIVSKVQKDLEHVMVSDLLEFKSQLETVIMDIARGTCSLAYIKEGCIEIHWFVPTHCIEDAYKSAYLKRHKFSTLHLQYLQIGAHRKICDPSNQQLSTVDLPFPSSAVTSKVVIDVIDYFGQYQPTEMDWDLILHYMLSQKLSNDPSSQQPSQTTTIALPLPSSAGLYVEKKQDIVSRFDISKMNTRRAFLYLTSSVSKLLQNADFYAIRRSCIEQISTPNGAQLSPDMVQKIKTANNLNALLDTLAESPYWSCIDLRLLEGIVIASGSNVAMDLLRSYQNCVFSKKLLEVLPSIPNKEVKDAYYSVIVTKFSKDIEVITVFDLLEFQSELETVIMDLKNGTSVLARIEKGCTEIHWFVPIHCIYHAYKSACLNCHKFCTLHLQYLQIGTHRKIYDTSSRQPSQATTVELPLPSSADYKDVIDHFSHYLTTEMDSDLIVEHMLSQQLLNDQEVHTIMSAASSFQKNCLILEKIRLMDAKSLVSFCEILQKFDCQRHIASALLNALKSFDCLSSGAVSQSIDDVVSQSIDNAVVPTSITSTDESRKRPASSEQCLSSDAVSHLTDDVVSQSTDNAAVPTSITSTDESRKRPASSEQFLSSDAVSQSTDDVVSQSTDNAAVPTSITSTGESRKRPASSEQPDDQKYFKPSLVGAEFLDMKIQLEQILQDINSQRVYEQCESLMASHEHNIALFSTDYLSSLNECGGTPEILQRLSPYYKWSDHSVLHALVQACNNPEAAMLLQQFDSQVDLSLPITEYPVPHPIPSMIPYDTSTQTLLAVKLNAELSKFSLQQVVELRCLIQKTFQITEHSLQLMAAESDSTILYWMIPKSICHLISSKSMQDSSLYGDRVQAVCVYPETVFVGADTLKLESFFNKVDQMQLFNTPSKLQSEETPKGADVKQHDIKHILEEDNQFDQSEAMTSSEQPSSYDTKAILKHEYEQNEAYWTQLKESKRTENLLQEQIDIVQKKLFDLHKQKTLSSS